MSGAEKVEVIAETPYLRFVKRGRWSFVERTSNVRVVAIVAVTKNDELVLVEQFRPATDSRVIELPAGLAGDILGQQDESLETAARRELLEETGYEATTWAGLPTVTSSSGLTSERVTLFRATGLEKVGPGGGDESEDIDVHLIPLSELEAWLAKAADSGHDIDSRVFAALHWARQ